MFPFSLMFSLLNCILINSRLHNLEDIFQPFVSKILSYAYVYIHMFTHICVCGYVYVHAHICVYVYTHTHA